MTEVQRRYREATGERFTKVGLSTRAEIARPTLDNWLERGVMPTPEGMSRLGQAIGVPAAQLWARWLDLGSSQDGLDRIADEIAALRQVISESLPAPGVVVPLVQRALDDAAARLDSPSSLPPPDPGRSAEG